MRAKFGQAYGERDGISRYDTEIIASRLKMFDTRDLEKDCVSLKTSETSPKTPEDSGAYVCNRFDGKRK